MTGAALKCGLATQEQFGEWPAGLDEWQATPFAVGAVGFGECLAYKVWGERLGASALRPRIYLLVPLRALMLRELRPALTWGRHDFSLAACDSCFRAPIWCVVTGLPVSSFYLTNIGGYASRLNKIVSDVQPILGASLPFIAITLASLSVAALGQVLWPLVLYFKRRCQERRRIAKAQHLHLEEQIRLDEEDHLDAINEGPAIRWLKDDSSSFQEIQEELIKYYELVDLARFVLAPRQKIQREAMAASVETRLEKLSEALSGRGVYSPPIGDLGGLEQVQVWVKFMAKLVVLAGLGDLNGARQLGSKFAIDP